jgi:PilZ domain
MSKPEGKGNDELIGIPKLDALRQARRDSRFRLIVRAEIYSPSAGVVPGQTLDISDHGLSVTLPVELPIDQVVRLNFKLQIGRVDALATVRNRNESRHGFEFVEPNPAQHLIRENAAFSNEYTSLNRTRAS